MRKQTFGVEIYDLMEELENNNDSNDANATAAKETKIRSVFDAARKDIAVFQAKKDCKKEEMAVLDAESGFDSTMDGTTPAASNIPPSSGTSSHQ